MTECVHSVEIGDVVIGGLDGPVTFEEIIGWYTVPDLKGQLDGVPSAHGSFARVNKWRASRAITVRGALRADDRFQAETLMSDLARAWEAATVMRVNDETGRWNSGIEVDRVTFSDRGSWSRQIPFTIDLVAPDPARYRDVVLLGPIGLPVREGGLRLPAEFPWNFGKSIYPTADVVNTGTLPIRPIVKLNGSALAVGVYGGPRTVVFGPFSGELVIDNFQRRVFLNGVDVTRRLTARNWHEVPAGATQSFSFEAVDPSPDLNLTVEYRIGVL